MTKLLTWNVANQTRLKRMPIQMASAIASLTPDIVVLTEYVPGDSRDAFLTELAHQGLEYRCVSLYTPKQNHILMETREILRGRRRTE